MTTNSAPPAEPTIHYRPGEMVVVTELPQDAAQQGQAHQAVMSSIETSLAGQTGGTFHQVQRRPEPIVFTAPDRPPLGFLFYDLAQPGPGFVKQVVDQSNARQLAALDASRAAGVEPVGAMPHWLGSAQDNYSDGSPASLPRPARLPGDGRWRHRYTAADAAFDFRRRVADAAAAQQVPVVVLDTMPDWTAVQARATQLSGTNAQLVEMVDLLTREPLPTWHAAALQERDSEGIKLAPTADGRDRGHDESDHGLFVSGLIHDLAPGSPLSLRPVLNRFGVGDLHLLLAVLQDIMRGKSLEQPLVINMSLGFVPKVEHLPWIWSGVNPTNDPDFVGDVPISGAPRDRAWLIQNADDVVRTTHLLHAGLDRLTRYLLANNCLGVAAAGNDSYRRVETGRPRLGPRIPALYRSVLGVGATTTNPEHAAPYSNVGDALEFGDHVSTFGGGVTPDDEPLDGVVGIYGSDSFPSHDGGARPPNDTGFASWSGTSFSTGIVSGLVAGYWTNERAQGRNAHAADVLTGFSTLATEYAPALRTASIGMQGDWLAA
jgi:hypothetical protein